MRKINNPAALCILTIIMILISCKKHSYNTASVLSYNIQGNDIEFIIAKAQGYDRSPIGSGSVGFIDVNSSIYSVIYKINDEETNGKVIVYAPSNIQLITTTTGREHHVDQIFQELVKKGVIYSSENNLGRKSIELNDPSCQEYKRMMEELKDLDIEKIKIVARLTKSNEIIYVIVKKSQTIIDILNGPKYQTSTEANYSATVDLDNSRIIFWCEKKPSNTIIGFNDTVKIWQYTKDKITEMEIKEPSIP